MWTRVSQNTSFIFLHRQDFWIFRKSGTDVLHAKCFNLLLTFITSPSMVVASAWIPTGHLIVVVWTVDHNIFSDKNFSVAGSRLWNSLPTSLQKMTNYGQGDIWKLIYLEYEKSLHSMTFDLPVLYKYPYCQLPVVEKWIHVTSSTTSKCT